MRACTAERASAASGLWCVALPSLPRGGGAAGAVAGRPAGGPHTEAACWRASPPSLLGRSGGQQLQLQRSPAGWRRMRPGLAGCAGVPRQWHAGSAVVQAHPRGLPWLAPLQGLCSLRGAWDRGLAPQRSNATQPSLPLGVGVRTPGPYAVAVGSLARPSRGCFTGLLHSGAIANDAVMAVARSAARGPGAALARMRTAAGCPAVLPHGTIPRVSIDLRIGVGW